MRAYKRPQFLLDLAEELNWLSERAGPQIAEDWYQALKKTVLFLRKNPFAGRPRKDLSPPNLRSWRISGFPRWLIFYTAEADGRLILHRVRQGTMNLLVLKMQS